MKTKLIFVDIDGTLTPPGSNVPPQSALDAIRAAQKKGHKVFLCSGRNRALLSPLLQYGFDGIVASAGGYVMAGDKVLYDCPMTAQESRMAVEALHRHGVFCTVEAVDGTFGDEKLDDFLADAPTAQGNSELERWRKALAANLGIRPMSEYDGRPIYKIVMMYRTNDQLDEARSLLEQDFEFCEMNGEGASIRNAELMNRKFSKGTGILCVCRELGVPVEDTVGLGDSVNDLAMIDTVETSVCMENGSEAVKARSDLICPSVEQDGLAWAFAELGLV